MVNNVNDIVAVLGPLSVDPGGLCIEVHFFPRTVSWTSKPDPVRSPIRYRVSGIADTGDYIGHEIKND